MNWDAIEGRFIEGLSRSAAQRDRLLADAETEVADVVRPLWAD